MADFLITAADVAAYAELSHDFNALHTDPAAAAASPLGRLVPHGFLLLGAAFQALHGDRPGVKELRVAFRAPGRIDEPMRFEPGDADGAFRVLDADGKVLAEGTTSKET